MGYDHGDSLPFDFEPNGIPFGSKSKGKLSPRSHPIQYERKWKYSFLIVLLMPSLHSNEGKFSQNEILTLVWFFDEP